MLIDQTIIFGAGVGILALVFWFFASEREKRRRTVGSFLIAGVLVLTILALNPPSFLQPLSKADQAKVEKGEAVERKPTLKPGIDIAGGSAFTLEVQPKEDEETGESIPPTRESVTQAIKTLRGRLNPEGNKDLLIQPIWPNRINIQMPGISEEEAEETRSKIQTTARLELREVHPQSSYLAPRVKAGEAVEPGYKHYTYERLDKEGKPIVEELLLSKRVRVKGSHVNFAAADFAQKGVVQIRLNSDGGDAMRTMTSKMTLGRDRLAVVLDGKVLSAPVVQAILGSQFVIEGLDSYEEAQGLSAALMNPLENPLEILEERSVSPRLGEATVKQGINAGIAGLGLTLIFILLYYRMAGIIALIGLSINIVVLFGAMALFGFTFTLPGIAGIILTIGVAVDANVLIYERMREELESGKSLAGAIRTAYEKAFSAIFDANITTLITATILFWRASDTVKGFAVTLSIGILASMFAALVATRVLFWWGTDSGLVKKLSFWNLVPEKSLDFMSKRKAALSFSVVLFVAALGVIGIKQDKSLGIDFVGGATVRFQLGDTEVKTAEVDSALSDLSLAKKPLATAEIVPGTGELLSVNCSEEDVDKVTNELRKDIPALAEADVTTEKVGAALGGEFLLNSLVALGIGLIAILCYIAIRFEFSFAVGAFVALLHDMVICIGIIIAFGHELSLIHVGAILTIAGYSINDTIVVFDRIRETLQVKRGSVVEIMNYAINATLSRTILTSATTFVAVLVLFIFGGPNLADFAFAIMVGVIVGTYSSIFVASPMVLFWSEKRGTNLRRELLDANLEAQVNPARG